MELDGQFLSVMDKFCTAGAKGRADDRSEIIRSTLVYLLHPANCLLDDVERASLPAVMECANGLMHGIIEQDCLAVGLLDQQSDTGLAGDKGICTGILRVSVDVVDNNYLIAMNLNSRCKIPASEEFLKPLAVLLHIL